MRQFADMDTHYSESYFLTWGFHPFQKFDYICQDSEITIWPYVYSNKIEQKYSLFIINSLVLRFKTLYEKLILT